MKRGNAKLIVGLCALIALGSLILFMGACQQEAPRPRADLTPYPLQIPLGLEKDYAKWIPADNPLTVAKVELGKKLYFDPRLSVDGNISCATCHNSQFGFSNGVPVSAGFQGKLGDRNSPTTLNRLYSTLQFWDGRAKSLEDQALGPVQNPAEMANTLPGMIANLNKISGYKPEFLRAFGSEEITADRVGEALATFERTLLSGNSPYDRFQAGDTEALSESAKRGLVVFMGKGKCNECHTLPYFTDEQFHNLGVGMDKPKPDLGRFDVTHEEKDKGAFKTPTLRNIAETYPYMHDGSVETLDEVVEIYDRGGTRNPYLDAKIKPLGLSEKESKDLVEFLKSLTGEPLKIEPPTLPQ
jgi:cytochrome c peroxidase